MDLSDFINVNRSLWNDYISGLIVGLKTKFAPLISPLSTTRRFLNGPITATNKIKDKAVYLTGGAAYIAYDAFAYNQINSPSPMLKHTPLTSDWDVNVHLKDKLTQRQQLDLLVFFQNSPLVNGQWPLHCDPPKIAADESYYSYALYVFYNKMAHNVFEISFRPSEPLIKEINILTFNAFGLPTQLPVPDLLSLIRLSLIAINNRAPIKIKNAYSGKYIKNDRFYKCNQDYARLSFILNTVQFYRMDLRPLPLELHDVKLELGLLLEKYPHCKRDIFKDNKIDTAKKTALGQQLWAGAERQNRTERQNRAERQGRAELWTPQEVRQYQQKEQNRQVFYDALEYHK
jgi:hypothetical protein